MATSRKGKTSDRRIFSNIITCSLFDECIFPFSPPLIWLFEEGGFWAQGKKGCFDFILPLCARFSTFSQMVMCAGHPVIRKLPTGSFRN